MTVPPIESWDRLLDGRVAVVTGGADGIGGAISQLFAQHGALVEVADINPQQDDHIRADVTDDDDLARLARTVLDRHGRVDILVNNVGDYRPLVRFERSTPESWRQMYDVNLRHVFAVTRAFLPSMIEQRRGSIVNVHSVEGLRGYPGDPVYAAMKAAVAHFTTSLAVSVGRHGVRVNGIGPDLTQTPQVDYVTGFEEHQDLWPSWAPVGRLGWPEDQARVALFLASDLSSFVTGATLDVNGGAYMH